MPPHRLSLKINQPVMLLRNVNQAEGLCNGTRLIIQELHKHYLKVIMTMGKNKGKIFLIQRMVITPSDIKIPVNIRRLQFPIRPAFAVTINKSQ